MIEINLDHGELINQVETKTNKATGRLIRLRIGTTKNRCYDSRKSMWTCGNFLTAWDTENWSHNSDFEQAESLVLAYCSGRDETGNGVGRILNLHWVPTEDVNFPAEDIESQLQNVLEENEALKDENTILISKVNEISEKVITTEKYVWYVIYKNRSLMTEIENLATRYRDIESHHEKNEKETKLRKCKTDEVSANCSNSRPIYRSNSLPNRSERNNRQGKRVS